MRVVWVLVLALAGCAQGGTVTTWDGQFTRPPPTPRGSTAYAPSPNEPVATPAARPQRPIEPLRLSPARLALYQRAVADQLRDPQAAQFRNVRAIRDQDGDEALCGEVNGKNAYGGYIGFQPFYAAIVAIGNRASAVLWMPPGIPVRTVLMRCGIS